MPEFKRMHEMTVDHVHEEIQLLAIDISTMLFETIAPMPTWRDHYLARDQRPSYAYLKVILQALQWLRGGSRWVLKSPQHLEQFPALLDTFPDGVFVVTHRDPVSVTTSMVTMLAYSARLGHDTVDLEWLGAYWVDRLQRMLTACAASRDVLPADRSIDVHFDDVHGRTTWPWSRRIYEIAGQPLTEEGERAMSRFVRDHPRGRHGGVDYDLSQFGLDRAQLKEYFRSLLRAVRRRRRGLTSEPVAVAGDGRPRRAVALVTSAFWSDEHEGDGMEFGLFIQGYVPKFRREVDPDAEHHAFMDELEIVQAADKAGFKYVWVTEHHFLDEYSHLSANDVVLGYLAHATERIHLGSGIFNPLPQVNHPAKVAERVAMLDHLSDGRFEFGTGRGAGSLEILGFLPGMKDLSGTREIWEDVIGEFAKMWLQDEYQGYDGKFWSLPPRKVLPKPYGKLHPAMWYAAGNTSSYEMAARRGLGRARVLGRILRRARTGAQGLQGRHRQR